MKLQPDGVVVEPAARQPGPLDGVLAFLDVLFRRAALIVKGDDALSTAREVGHDKADARVQLTWMPLDLGDDPTGLRPSGSPIAEAGVIPAHVLGRSADGALEQMADACPGALC